MNERHATYQYDSTGKLDSRIAMHRYGSNPRRWYAWVLDRLPLRRGQHVLEVGAGTGELWSAADLDGITLTLTDASAAMCEALRGRTLPNATVHRCRADALPFADSSVDAVVANHMLYHLDDPRTGLREMRRVLRPGGWIAAATNGRNQMLELRHIACRAGVPDATPTTQLAFSRENGPALLARYFDNVRELTYPDELVVPSAGPVLDYLTSCADRPLAGAEVCALRNAVEAVIHARGECRITKDTALLTARKP